jgi:hypothetical protein
MRWVVERLYEVCASSLANLATSIQPRGKSRESLAVSRLLRTTTAPTPSNHKPLLSPLSRRDASTLPMPVGSPDTARSLKSPYTESPLRVPSVPHHSFVSRVGRIRAVTDFIVPLRDSQQCFDRGSWRSRAVPSARHNDGNTSFAPWKPRLPCLVLSRLPIGGCH